MQINPKYWNSDYTVKYYTKVKAAEDYGKNEFKTNKPWYKRIWYILTNPFLYVFAGRIRY